MDFSCFFDYSDEDELMNAIDCKQHDGLNNLILNENKKEVKNYEPFKQLGSRFDRNQSTNQRYDQGDWDSQEDAVPQQDP